MPERLLVLDGDYGVDDAIALLSLAGEPGVRIVAVGSVHGNTDAARAARNALTVLYLVGLREVPVAVGAARPLAQPVELSAEVHGDDGLGGAAPPPTAVDRQPVGTPAAVQLVEVVRAHPGGCTLLATGPLTNLALAVLLDPGIVGLVARVVVMGGTLDAPGNVGTHTEANFAHDPEAADLVLAAGWPVTVVGLDVTMRTWLEEADLARLAASGTPAARFASAMLLHYVEFYLGRYGRRGCPMHDPTAARLALQPELAGYIELPAGVELRSPTTRGMLLVDRRPFASRPPGATPVRVAVDVDRDAVVGRLVDRLVGGVAGLGGPTP